MNNYNACLLDLRKKNSLSLKDASKGIGISKLRLYLYENGYFRPSKKYLEKINNFYHSDLTLDKENAYPIPTSNDDIPIRKGSIKKPAIVFGILSALSLGLVFTGVGLFNKSVNNNVSYYGKTYNAMKQKVIEKGQYAHDLVTSMKYYYVTGKTSNAEYSYTFYQTNNMLYFNECNYSETHTNGTQWGVERYHYQFGSNLGVNSYVCKFTYSNLGSGTCFSCEFDFDGAEVTKISELKILVQGTDTMDAEKAITKINSRISNVDYNLSILLRENLEEDVNFLSDFLPDREKGRVINFSLQVSGLILIFTDILAFFIFFSLFVRTLIKNVKPRLVTTEPSSLDKTKENLPQDWNINFGIPDIFIVLLAKVLQYGSMVLFIVALVAKLGIPFLSAFASPNLLTIFKWSLLGGIFLEHFVMIGRIKKPSTLFKEIVYNVGFFLFIATLETVVISITNAWGYDFAALVYKYVPSNVYQVVAIHYLIFLFLFFEPPFLNHDKKWHRIVWHSLSLIPLGTLTAAYIISNRFAFTYGVKENIYINFWFPNAFLSLSIVSVLFLYATFFIRLYFEKRYGKYRSHLFFYGDKYTIYENAICAILIIIAASVDFIFVHNQYASYLGLGGNYWLFMLVPLILLCKYSPNNQQVFLMDEGFRRLVGNKEEQ